MLTSVKVFNGLPLWTRGLLCLNVKISIWGNSGYKRVSKRISALLNFDLIQNSIKCSRTSSNWSNHSCIKYINIKEDLFIWSLLRFSMFVRSFHSRESASFYADLCPLSKIYENHLDLVWCGPITEPQCVWAGLVHSRTVQELSPSIITTVLSSLLSSMCDCWADCKKSESNKQKAISEKFEISVERKCSKENSS